MAQEDEVAAWADQTMTPLDPEDEVVAWADQMMILLVPADEVVALVDQLIIPLDPVVIKVARAVNMEVETKTHPTRVVKSRAL